MKAHTTPAGSPADTIQEASGPSAAEVSHARASAALRDLDDQLAERRRHAEEAQATIDAIEEETTAERTAATRLEAEAVKLQAARADALLRANLAAGTPDEAAATLRVASFDDQIHGVAERQRAQRAEATAQATAREAQQVDAQQRLAQAQASTAELRTQRAHLAQIAREAHERLGFEKAAAVEREVRAAQQQILDLQQALSLAEWRLREAQDSIIEQLKPWPEHAAKLDSQLGRPAEVPDDARVTSLRAYLAFVTTLGDDQLSNYFDVDRQMNLFDALSLRADTLSELLRTREDERGKMVSMLKQRASVMLARFEHDAEDAAERHRASRRARLLGHDLSRPIGQ